MERQFERLGSQKREIDVKNRESSQGWTLKIRKSEKHLKFIEKSRNQWID